MSTPITKGTHHIGLTVSKLEESAKAFTDLKAAHDKLQADFTALATQLDTDPATGTPRPPATGGKAVGFAAAS